MEQILNHKRQKIGPSTANTKVSESTEDEVSKGTITHKISQNEYQQIKSQLIDSCLSATTKSSN
jgi:hypothetical protein